MSTATLAPPARVGVPLHEVEPPWWRRPRVLLAVVAVLHAASPLVLLGVHWWYGIDETVYLSQINAHVPPGYFSAPRARGATFIAAPITSWTSSVAAVRIWVTALSGLALYAGFAPWLRLRRGYVVPLAALMLSTLWTVTYYGFEVMPNEWVAFAALGACGYALRYLDEGRRRYLVAVAASGLWIALLRPSDAAFAGGGLALCVLFARGAGLRRRVGLIATLAVGAGIGVAEWVIEAETTYGGLLKRIHAAQGEQGGGGLHFAGGAQLRAVAGPLLCRFGCKASAPVVYQLWWVVLLALVVIGVVTARRRGEVMLVVVGLAMATQYVFTVTYAAPRFLIPTYALLSVPAATGVLSLLRAVRRQRWRTLLRVVLIGGLLANTALQVRVIMSHIAPPTRAANHLITADAAALRSLGVTKSCLLIGSLDNARLAYATACTDIVHGRPSVVSALQQGHRVVWFRSTKPSKTWGVPWQRVSIPGRTAATPQVAYLSG